jgi:hypothetical protein
MTDSPITTVEYEALCAWRDRYGRTWRRYLLAAWLGQHYNGCNMAGRDTGILREIRNQRGSAWLSRVKI